MRLSDIGEFGLIERLTGGLPIGDDAAYWKDGNQYQLATTDVLVDHIHFRLDWSTPLQVGRKCVEHNVSDIAAMGGLPKKALLSFILPKRMDVSIIDGIMAGIRERCEHYAITIVGGNVSQGKELSITMTLLGTAKKPILRSTASPGELVCVTGKLGKGAAGLLRCRQGERPRAFLEPKAPLEASKIIARYATSMIDITDGLAGELHHLAKASGVGFLIEKERIPLHPLTAGHEDRQKLAIYSGDELELLFTVRTADIQKIKTRFSIIGTVTKKAVCMTDGKAHFHLKNGYDHLR